MPEVIEVKIYSDFIKKYTQGHILSEINILKGRYVTHGPFDNYQLVKDNLPITLLKVGTKGKFTYLEFTNNIYIGVTLGLHGGWIYKDYKSNEMIHGMRRKKSDKKSLGRYVKKALNHLNVEFKFDNCSLYFYDRISFGTIKVYTKEELVKKLNTIGYDIMDKNTTSEIFMDKINKEKHYERYIGNILMDQKIIAGIGNYLRADALWLSKISPFRKIKDITKKEYNTLFYNCRLLVWGIYDYIKGINMKYITETDKLPYHYNRGFFVYHQKTDIYNNKIIKEKLYEGSQIRHIYWVKQYQK